LKLAHPGTSAAHHNDDHHEGPQPVLPDYAPDPKGIPLARFPSGHAITTRPGRLRAYPGLLSEAPTTLPLYRIAAKSLLSARHTVDLGCGAGEGFQALAFNPGHLIGLDIDPNAVAFAKEYLPTLTFRQADIAFAYDSESCDGALLVDVLGQVSNPFAVLRAAATRLVPGGTLVLAEPVAYPAQVLRVPMRRAFSKRALEAQLLAAGFDPVTVLMDHGPFVVLSAAKCPTPASVALAKGIDALDQGDFDAALASFRITALDSRKDLVLEARLSSADAHLARGDGDAACQEYFAAGKLDPTDARCLAGLAQLMLSSGETYEALRLARAALDLDTTEVSAAIVHAVVLESLEPDRAAAAWTLAANLAPDRFDPVVRLVQIASDTGRHAFALQNLERLRAYGDDHGTRLHLAFAHAFRAAGRRADARLEVQIALTKEPSDPEANLLSRQLRAD
jgi:predicted TPR repeat methyltransferase